MKIYFAGDHAGFEMKGKLMEFVRSLGHETEDLGPLEPKAGDDYPDFVIPLAKKVASHSPLSKGALPSSAGGMLKSPTLADSGTPFSKGGISSASADLGTSFNKGGTKEEVRGVVVAGSGQGEIIAMNRVRGARAALFCPCNLDLIKASRDHNDSNIFSIGARFCTLEEAKKGLQIWLETPFSNEERHLRRLRKIDPTTTSY